MDRIRWLIGILIVALNLVNLPSGRAEVTPVAANEDYDQAILSALVGLVDAHLLQVDRTLKVLAESAEVKSGKWDEMQKLVGAAMTSELPEILWFVQPDGTYYSSEKGLLDQKLADRPYFSKLMDGERIVGELVVSKSTGKKSIILAVPVYRDGKIIGGIGASIFVDDFSRILNRILKLPRGSVFYGLAPNGLTSFHIDPTLDFVDPRQLQSGTLRQAAQNILDHPSGQASYIFRGAARHVIFTTSPMTGWRVAYGRILGSSSSEAEEANKGKKP